MKEEKQDRKRIVERAVRNWGVAKTIPIALVGKFSEGIYKASISKLLLAMQIGEIRTIILDDKQIQNRFVYSLRQYLKTRDIDLDYSVAVRLKTLYVCRKN